MKIIEIPVPEEIIELLGSEDAARQGAHEAFIFDLVRRGKISKGKAAELLGISLWELPELITHYQIPWFRYSPEELPKELETIQGLQRGQRTRMETESFSSCT